MRVRASSGPFMEGPISKEITDEVRPCAGVDRQTAILAPSEKLLDINLKPSDTVGTDRQRSSVTSLKRRHAARSAAFSRLSK